MHIFRELWSVVFATVLAYKIAELLLLIFEIWWKSYIQIVDSKEFGTHSKWEGTVANQYESSKRCAADSGSATVRGYEVGIKETLFGTCSNWKYSFWIKFD